MIYILLHLVLNNKVKICWGLLNHAISNLAPGKEIDFTWTFPMTFTQSPCLSICSYHMRYHATCAGTTISNSLIRNTNIGSSTLSLNFLNVLIAVGY